MHLTALERLERQALRVAEIGAVLVKYGLADQLRRIPGQRIREWLREPEGQPISQLSPPERIRLALTELGTTFIKLGQMLSTRPDIVGPSLAHELGKLQSGTPADPPGAAQRTLERELGRPVESLFEAFDPEPFASASIAQVHAARLPGGRPVVLKIAKEGIEARIEADLAILGDLAELAEKHIEELRPYRPVAVVRQFARMLRGELDFARERRNLEEFRRHFAEDAGVLFPEPWAEYSSRRVLTMEFLEGVLISDVAALEGAGFDREDFARRGANLYLEMIFRDGFYHADPHPGNLMVLPGGVIGVLDCGMVQRLDERLREEMEGLLLAVIQGDTEALADGVWNLGTTPPAGRRDALRADVADFVAEYKGRSINDLALSVALTELLDIVHRHHVFLPPGVSLLLRTLVELEGTAQLLAPSFSLAEVMEPFYERSIQRRLSFGRLAHRAQKTFRDWDRLLRTLPRDLNEWLQQMRAGTMSVHLDHRRLDPVVNRLVMGLLTSSLFLGSALLWSMEAPPLMGGVSVFGAAGYAVSLVMGFRLLRAMRKAEAAPTSDAT